MAQIKNETEYRKLLGRIDELLKVVDDNTPTDDMNFIELDIISDLVEEYENVHYPIGNDGVWEPIDVGHAEMIATY